VNGKELGQVVLKANISLGHIFWLKNRHSSYLKLLDRYRDNTLYLGRKMSC